MSEYNLTGKTASSTYGRLVQIVDNQFYDGYGQTISIAGIYGVTGATGATGPANTFSQNIDGGFAASVYLPSQIINGGSA